MFAALKKVKNGIMVASGASFVLMGVYGLHIFDAEGASADTRLVSIASTGSGEYVTISSGGDINMTIVPTADGTLGAVESDVTVKTSVASGYSLYLNMANSAGSNVLYNTTDTSSYLSAAAGTPSTPATLATNQWGFAIANNTTDKSTNSCTNNEYHKRVAELIDKRIDSAYKLFVNNYIAHDLRYGKTNYKAFYTDEQLHDFLRHMDKLNDYDVTEPDILKDIFLGIYANPVEKYEHRKI